VHVTYIHRKNKVHNNAADVVGGRDKYCINVDMLILCFTENTLVLPSLTQILSAWKRLKFFYDNCAFSHILLTGFTVIYQNFSQYFCNLQEIMLRQFTL